MFSGKKVIKKRPSDIILTQDNTVVEDIIEETSTLPKEITDVMDSIRLNWDFMSSENFNPIPEALSLLDKSSLGSDMGKFNIMYDRLEKSMDLIVNGTPVQLKTKYWRLSN